jgi:hypothetical protein
MLFSFEGWWRPSKSGRLFTYLDNVYFYFKHWQEESRIHFQKHSAKQTVRNMFDTGPGESPCQSVTPITAYAEGRCTNNAVKLSAANNANKLNFYLTWVYSGFLQLDTNWISNSWGSGSGQGVDGDGTAYTHSFTSIYQTGNDAHRITGIGSLIIVSVTPFDTSASAPTASSPLVSAAAALPAAVSPALPVTMQYNPTTYLMTPMTSTTDIGAV